MTIAAAGDPAEAREQFIPVRKADLLDALIEHGSLASEVKREEFRQICRSLAAIYHYEYFEQLERLRNEYFYFNPELDPHARLDAAALANAYGDLVDSFEAGLKNANFVELSHAEIDAAHQQRRTMRLKVTAALDDFRDVRFFHRDITMRRSRSRSGSGCAEKSTRSSFMTTWSCSSRQGGWARSLPSASARFWSAAGSAPAPS